jgi:galactose mutarotase-like enzyme
MTTVQWQGFDAWQMENEQIRVVIVPALGAKIASLVDKTAGYEWLAPPTNPVRERRYADVFTDHDLAGWDEMFPTISMCPSPHNRAIELPDHGEVWALSWEVLSQSPQLIKLQVQGRALDYLLTRTASLLEDGFRLEYTLENLNGKPFPFLWAAHPLFNADSSTVIELPPEITRVINVAERPDLGGVDAPLSWPAAALANGGEKRLDRVGDASRKDSRKVYVPPEQPVDSACLYQESIGRRLCLRWDSGVAPYLGIWVDEGTYTRPSTAALEPASGYYDSLALAQQNQRAAIAPISGPVQWWLDVRLSS